MYLLRCRKTRFESIQRYDEFHAERYQKAIRAKGLFARPDICPEKTCLADTTLRQSDPFASEGIGQPELPAKHLHQVDNGRHPVSGNLFMSADSELPSCRRRLADHSPAKRKPAKKQNQPGCHTGLELDTETVFRHVPRFSRCARQPGTGYRTVTAPALYSFAGSVRQTTVSEPLQGTPENGNGIFVNRTRFGN